MFSPAYLVKAHSEKASKVLYKFLNLKEYNRLKTSVDTRVLLHFLS